MTDNITSKKASTFDLVVRVTPWFRADPCGRRNSKEKADSRFSGPRQKAVKI